VAIRSTESRFRGEPAIVLEAGSLTATFLPDVGMTGVSLRFRGREHLALPGGVGHLRAGGTGGLPLLAPWANRLASRRYRAAGVTVDLSDVALPVDGNGLPIHGLVLGVAGWKVERMAARGAAAILRTSLAVDQPAFPFPHRIELAITARDGELTVDTTIVPTGRRRVPLSFGWHPYLKLPGVARSSWRLRLPARRHLALDDFGIPTGAVVDERAEAAPIARRTFDDLYALGRDRRLSFAGDDGQSIELRCASGYPYAQVWVPKGQSFAALEPMVAPTNALVAGSAPLVAPGDSYRARFALSFT
jgi:galactose mutarotase-like enzyme